MPTLSRPRYSSRIWQILLYVQDQIDEKAFVKYYQHIEINEKRLKDFYTFIAEPTQLRPLEWL